MDSKMSGLVASVGIDQSPVGALADEYLARYCEIFPSAATAFGVAGYDHLLDSYGDDTSAEVALYEEFIARLESVAVGSAQEELAREVMLSDLRSCLQLTRSGAHHLAWGVINSPAAEIYELISITPYDTPEGVANLSSRIVFVGEALRQWRGALLARARGGVVNSRRESLEVIAQFKKFADDKVYTKLALQAGVEVKFGEVADSVHQQMAEFLQEVYLPLTREGEGVGREAYQILADSYVGKSVDLEASYSAGMAEVEQIREEMLSVAAQIKDGASLEEVIELLDSDEQYKIHGADALVGSVKGYIQGAVASLNGVEFDIPEAIGGCEVQLDLVSADASPYYIDPSDDFSRAGSVWYPTLGSDVFTLWRQLSTIYHEGVPGHHLQIATAMLQREKLTSYQRLLAWSSGYGEGWALYSERLMDELGYFADPAMRMGHLIDRALRTVRVVIDIGLHCGFSTPFADGQDGWEFERVLEYFLGVTQTQEEYARSEVNRYISWPGQAISYKLGEQSWLAARAANVARGVSRREFHNNALADGPMSLELFERRQL